MVQHWQLNQLAHSIVTHRCSYRTNGFPCISLKQRKHDEPFGERHIRRHHLDYDLLYQELEERISVNKKKEFFYIKVNEIRRQLPLERLNMTSDCP